MRACSTRGCEAATRARPRAGRDRREAGPLYPKDYWPTDGDRHQLDRRQHGAVPAALPHYFGEPPVRDVGLIASEGRMTIPLADGTPSGVLDITSHYFEFIPEGEID